jgi:general secretion pathway protein G
MMKTRGFTLLELLIVVAILALLASIAVPVYMGRADEARLQKVQADFATLAAALSLYKLDNQTVPTSSQGLQALVSKPNLPPEPLRYKGDGYLREVPRDPWGNAYLYLAPAPTGAKEYALYSYGADGVSGGEDLDADLSF